MQKVHVENMHLVMSDEYPALREVMNKFLITGETNAEELTDMFSGVPSWRGNQLLSSLEHKMRDLVGPPEPFPDECEYIHLGEDQATFQSEEVRQRSERLYHKKMSEAGEVKEMCLVECGIHVGTEVKMVLEMYVRSNNLSLSYSPMQVCFTNLKGPSFICSQDYPP